MIRLFRHAARLGGDTRGGVFVEYLLLCTIVGIGMIVGLATFRNSVVQEFGDLAVALDHLDQSWTVQHSWEESPGRFEDPGPQLVDGEGESDPDGAEPAGISAREPPTAEGEPLPGD